MHLRPLPQYRPHDARTGCRTRRLRSCHALIAALLAAALLTACGGSDKPAIPTTAASAPALFTAASLLPKVDDLGFQVAQQGRDPVAPAQIDSAQAIYLKTGTNRSIQVRIYVMPTVDLARQQFTAYAENFRNPPPDVLGVPSKNVDTPSPRVGDDQKSYVTEKPDGQGNNVWTDIYRAGRAVFLTQVLDAATSDSMPIRKTLAERIAASVK